jgi:hypothetical protein
LSSVAIHGAGAISPAGWRLADLRGVVAGGSPLADPMVLSGSGSRCLVRRVPAPVQRPVLASNPRLRRSSPITQFAVAAALEAIGCDAQKVQRGELRLGIIVCVTTGCVNYSRRFYGEALNDPARASPLVFPETVFNAPASHLGALLESTSVNYTIVGDAGSFLIGLALAADWLAHGDVDACVVTAAEEIDGLSVHGLGLFFRKMTLAEGAGALYLKRAGDESKEVLLECISQPHLFTRAQSRAKAIQLMQSELPKTSDQEALVLSDAGGRWNRAEQNAWSGNPARRFAPKKLLGESFVASAAWQAALAYDLLARSEYPAATISVVGFDQQAIGARLAVGSEKFRQSQ